MMAGLLSISTPMNPPAGTVVALRKAPLIAVITVVHLILSVGVGLLSFAATLGRFDSGALPTPGERTIASLSRLLLFPVVEPLARLLPRSFTSGGFPREHLLFLANSLLWATTIAALWALIRRRRIVAARRHPGRALRRVAALYDIHGNLPALEAALDAVNAWGADAVVVGGDVVLGPMPRECLARLLAYRSARVHFLRGNCDRLVAGAGEGRLDAEPRAARLPAAVRTNIAWVADALTPAERATCAHWPASVTLGIEGLGPVHFCHATPRSDDELFTADTPEARLAPMFAGIAERVVVCGHTHMQFDRTLEGGVRVLNAGSVGMPYGAPGAHWLRLGPEGVVFERTPYDLDAAAARVRATRLPGAAEFAATSILAPASTEVMRAAFSVTSPGSPSPGNRS